MWYWGDSFEQDDPTDELMEKNLKGLQRKLLEITEEITETLEAIKYFQADLADEEEEVNRWTTSSWDYFLHKSSNAVWNTPNSSSYVLLWK